MKIMLDNSPAKIKEKSERFGFEFWQLRTPLTRHALCGKPYGLDNGCFNRFDKKTWFRLLDEAEQNPPVFTCMPDIVGDARRTLDLFYHFERKVPTITRALVLQDGIGMFPIPWDRITAVFVGGSDKFKISQEAINACKTAKILDKWVHIGRVNEIRRLKNWVGLADSIDGSGISRFDHMLEKVVRFLNDGSKQLEMFENE